MTARPDDWRLPDGRRGDVAGRGEMFIREVSGPPGAAVVVLLHGRTSRADITWYGVFARPGERFRVIAPDLRCHGPGPRDGRRASIGDVVADVAALLKALRLAPAVVAGYSLGGAVTQRLARGHEDLVAGVVLCASASRFTAVPVSRRWVRVLDFICGLAAVLPDAVAAAVAEAIMRILYGWDGFQRWAVPLMRRHRWSNVLYLAADLAVFDSSNWIGDLAVPVAVLLTADDVHVPTERQALLAGVSKAHPSGHRRCGNSSEPLQEVRVDTRYLKDLPRSVEDLRCRLLFMEVVAGRAVVDAVVSSRQPGRPPGTDDDAPVGSPLTLVAELPTRPWGLAAKATLERWIWEGREVELRLRRREADRGRVEAVTDEASMLLDLAV